jgi:hypothetical protein
LPMRLKWSDGCRESTLRNWKFFAAVSRTSCGSES